MLKQCLLALVLGTLVYSVAPSAIAQDNGNSDQQSAQAAPPQEGHRHHNFDPAKRTKMLTKRLNLTADQQPKVLDILKSEQSQMQSLHSDTSLSQDDRRSKMMDIHKSTRDQIRAILDPDQQKQWDEMQSRRQRWQSQRENQQQGGATPNSNQ